MSLSPHFSTVNSNRLVLVKRATTTYGHSNLNDHSVGPKIKPNASSRTFLWVPAKDRCRVVSRTV